MKFSTRQDAELSAESLFRAVSDFDAVARQLSRRGASVRRLDKLSQPGTGMNWVIGFDWRGRHREFTLDVTSFDAPELIEMQGRSDQFEITIRMTVVALAATRSRLIFELDLAPLGMKARLLLQTARLGKGRLDRKFAHRIAEFVNQLGPGHIA